jgi:hypothetical protein
MEEKQMLEGTTPAENAHESAPTEGRAGKVGGLPTPDDQAGRLVVATNAALVGVPAAYMTTQSVPVTLVTAGVAVVFARLARRPR